MAKQSGVKRGIQFVSSVIGKQISDKHNMPNFNLQRNVRIEFCVTGGAIREKV
jgi:hypothetical protein